MTENQAEEFKIFGEMLEEYRYDFVTLAYLIFGFGEPGTEMEDIHPYDWQIEEWRLISEHLRNPLTRFQTYRLIVSSGNGAAKTAFGAMTTIILMYTQKLRGRVTANTSPQLTSIIWPEYDVWFRRAKYNEEFFEKLGTSIKAKDDSFAEQWRLDQFNWDMTAPTRVSGLHNKGNAIIYIFEEAAGIPAVIWDYASGAFTDVGTIKIWLAFANSDDPESKFEQNMVSPEWRSLRIDTRTMAHVDPETIAAWLREYGDEDSDEFRVRVRGLPRKSSADAIIRLEVVIAAIEAGKDFDIAKVNQFPSVLTCDPAWQGGDETTIWHHQGNYHCLLERYRLNKLAGEDHRYTYDKLVYWEKKLSADAVLIDQGEGTGIKTLANADERHHWELVSFAGTPNDAPEFKDSEYQNIRAQMYYETNKDLVEGHVIAARDPKDLPDIQKQLTWTKGKRNDKSHKKQAEPKVDIKARVGQSPDLSDGMVMYRARKIQERRFENLMHGPNTKVGGRAIELPTHEVDYDTVYDSSLYD